MNHSDGKSWAISTENVIRTLHVVRPCILSQLPDACMYGWMAPVEIAYTFFPLPCQMRGLLAHPTATAQNECVQIRI